LCDYKWSSFPAYINEAVAPEWLFREKTYQMLGKKQKYVGYQNYISEGVDEDILRFYNRGNMAAVLGDRGFRESARDEVNGVDMDRLRSPLQDRPDINSIIKICADVLSVDEHSIRSKPVGRREPNSARAFAMWACQHYGGLALKDIASAFELGHPGSASFSINKMKKEVGENRWKESLVKLELHIFTLRQ
jgi:putative transposase